MKVKFLPSNQVCEVPAGKSILHVAEDNGIYIKSVCRGVPSCAECRVQVVEGESNVFPPNSTELGLIGTGHFIDHRRLSCQLHCMGDITVDLTEQLKKQEQLKNYSGGKNSKLGRLKDDRVEEEITIRTGEPEESERDSRPPQNSKGQGGFGKNNSRGDRKRR